ncbi:MAG: hypothetical protein FWC11_04805, partial [Firmicutes bacterium]|nr:hypothetical protein [Bacillota bacterium]
MLASAVVSAWRATEISRLTDFAFARNEKDFTSENWLAIQTYVDEGSVEINRETRQHGMAQIRRFFADKIRVVPRIGAIDFKLVENAF